MANQDNEFALITPPTSTLPPPPSHLTRAERYTLKIIHDTTARAGFEPENFTHAPFEKILGNLDQPALDHLIITLKNRLRAKQQAIQR